MAGQAYELDIARKVKGQVLVWGRRTKREAAAAVGSRTNFCWVLGEEVGETVYHHYSATAVVFVAETLVPNSMHQTRHPKYRV